MKSVDKPLFRTKHKAELVIYETAKSTLLAMQSDRKLSSLKSLQAEQQRLVYARNIYDTMNALSLGKKAD